MVGGRRLRSAEKLIESPNKEHLAFLKSKTMSWRLVTEQSRRISDPVLLLNVQGLGTVVSRGVDR